jgi:flagellar biogenesis protein FliO
VSTNSPKKLLLQGLKKNWLLMGLIALAAVAAGVSLPQNLPGVPHPTESAPASPPSEKSTLAYVPPSLPDAPSPRGMLLRLGLGTFLVLILCAGTLWVGKRWIQVSPVGGSAGTLLRVVETLPLGNRCALHLVTAGTRQILVGMDASGLKAMIPMTEPFENTLSDLTPEDGTAHLPDGPQL